MQPLDAECLRCFEVMDHDHWLQNGGYCPDCCAEVYHGHGARIPGPWKQEHDLDDDLTEDGRIDNAARCYEDDMPDATQWGYRDTELDDGPIWPHGYH